MDADLLDGDHTCQFSAILSSRGHKTKSEQAIFGCPSNLETLRASDHYAYPEFLARAGFIARYGSFI